MPVVYDWGELAQHVPGNPSLAQQTYLVEIVNLLLRAFDPGDFQIGMLFQDTEYNSGGALHRWPDAVIDCAEGVGANEEDVKAAKRVPRPLFAPPPPVAVNHWAANAGKRAQLALARTLLTQQRGDRLATAAEAMEGWFYWVSSGEAAAIYYAKPQQVTKQWDNRHNRDKRDREVHDPIQNRTIRRNTFLSWLLRGNKEPGIASNLNCWESVMFSAYRAGLVTRHTLQQLHQPGPNNLGVTYRDRYMAFLGYPNSFPFNEAGGLVPERGDVMFWGEDEHVAICVDAAVGHAGLVVTLMNHWSPPGSEADRPARTARFHRIEMDSLPGVLKEHPCKFVPCPF